RAHPPCADNREGNWLSSPGLQRVSAIITLEAISKNCIVWLKFGCNAAQRRSGSWLTVSGFPSQSTPSAAHFLAASAATDAGVASTADSAAPAEAPAAADSKPQWPGSRAGDSGSTRRKSSSLTSCMISWGLLWLRSPRCHLARVPLPVVETSRLRVSGTPFSTRSGCCLQNDEATRAMASWLCGSPLSSSLYTSRSLTPHFSATSSTAVLSITEESFSVSGGNRPRHCILIQRHRGANGSIYQEGLSGLESSRNIRELLGQASTKLNYCCILHAGCPHSPSELMGRQLRKSHYHAHADRIWHLVRPRRWTSPEKAEFLLQKGSNTALIQPGSGCLILAHQHQIRPLINLEANQSSTEEAENNNNATTPLPRHASDAAADLINSSPEWCSMEGDNAHAPVFKAAATLCNAVSLSMKSLAETHPAGSSAAQFIDRFLLREICAHLEAQHRVLRNALDSLESQGRARASAGTGETPELAAAAAAANCQGVVLPYTRLMSAPSSMQVQDSMPQSQADSAGRLQQEVQKLQRLVDRMEANTSFFTGRSEEAVMEEEEPVILVVRRRVTVQDEQLSRLRAALKKYAAELEGRVPQCLFLSVRVYRETGGLVIYEFWESLGSWRKFLPSPVSKELRKCIVDCSEAPESTETLLLPFIPGHSSTIPRPPATDLALWLCRIAIDMPKAVKAKTGRGLRSWPWGEVSLEQRWGGTCCQPAPPIIPFLCCSASLLHSINNWSPELMKPTVKLGITGRKAKNCRWSRSNSAALIVSHRHSIKSGITVKEASAKPAITAMLRQPSIPVPNRILSADASHIVEPDSLAILRFCRPEVDCTVLVISLTNFFAKKLKSRRTMWLRRSWPDVHMLMPNTRCMCSSLKVQRSMILLNRERWQDDRKNCFLRLHLMLAIHNPSFMLAIHNPIVILAIHNLIFMLAIHNPSFMPVVHNPIFMLAIHNPIFILAIHNPIFMLAIHNPIFMLAIHNPIVILAIHNLIFMLAIHNPSFMPVVHNPIFMLAIHNPIFILAIHNPIFMLAIHNPIFMLAIHNPIFMLAIHNPIFMPGVHNLSFMLAIHNLSFMLAIHNPIFMLAIHNPSFMPGVHNPSFMPGVHNPSFIPDVHNPSFMSGVHNPSFMPGVHNPHFCVMRALACQNFSSGAAKS
uniref:ABM domain-containing protein n=1 Tax=Macrostomum lignano TaxID=282301 RepID=A0A1I8I4W4_9PLAT